jgi:hypothetical protein
MECVLSAKLAARRSQPSNRFSFDHPNRGSELANSIVATGRFTNAHRNRLPSHRRMTDPTRCLRGHGKTSVYLHCTICLRSIRPRSNPIDWLFALCERRSMRAVLARCVGTAPFEPTGPFGAVLLPFGLRVGCSFLASPSQIAWASLSVGKVLPVAQWVSARKQSLFSEYRPKRTSDL